MREAIEQVLATARTGGLRFGQVAVQPNDGGGFIITHRDDEGEAGLQAFTKPEDALAIARFDESGEYRPLKTAPNLRRGWRLELQTLADLQWALDNFYPGRLAIFAAWRSGQLPTTSLRETLGRQTGIYRIAARISDQQIEKLTADFCKSDGGCLRTILWKRDPGGAKPSENLPPKKFDPAQDQAGDERTEGRALIPLLCQEACNLLVAECRKAVKSKDGGASSCEPGDDAGSGENK